MTLVREQGTDQGTYGVLTLPDGWQCQTIELPWRDNWRGLSRIPAGTYKAMAHVSPKFGMTYWVREVKGRSAILFHAGNLAGDRKKGFKTDSDGCILVGLRRGQLYRQNAVLASKAALKEMLARLNRQSVWLEVRDADPIDSDG
jgi:hypothetical protein